MEYKEAVEIICPEELGGFLEMLLPQHAELAGIATRDKEPIGQLSHIALQQLAVFFPSWFPIMLVLCLNNDTRAEL